MPSRKPLSKIRDAVCKCINEGIQEWIDDCGLDFKVNADCEFGPRQAPALCAYNPKYETCKDNNLRIHVFGVNRRYDLEDSKDGQRGCPKKLSRISAEYTVIVEITKILCSKDKKSIDVASIEEITELEDLAELIDEFLFCKRSIIVDGEEYYQDDTEPVQVPWDQRRLSESAMFSTQSAFTYRLRKCCPGTVRETTESLSTSRVRPGVSGRQPVPGLRQAAGNVGSRPREGATPTWFQHASVRNTPNT